MPKWIKAVLQYTISLGIAGCLLWYLFRDKDLGGMYDDIKDADFSWVFLSFGIALFSHLARAYRWKLLMEPLSYNPSTYRTFLAVMVGYMANIALPRAGEVARCAILYKSDKIPVNISFGTVVTERVFDLICLISVVIISFFVEFDRLSTFVLSMFEGRLSGLSGGGSGNFYIGIGGAVVLLVVFLFIARVLIKILSKSAWFFKIKLFLKGLIEGALSIKKLKKKKEFIAATIVIWVCYFYMSYVIFYALPFTSSLGLGAGFAVLLLGGIGMAMPVQGGVGTFHTAIQLGLVVYGLTEMQGLTYATLVHTSQMVMLIVVGLTSLVLALLYAKKNNQNEPEHEHIRENIEA